MNILFITYWGLSDGLTSSTVIPHVQLLANHDKIGTIVLCTMERNATLEQRRIAENVIHFPWKSSHTTLGKIRDFTRFPRKIAELIRRHNIQFMFCRGTPAGAIGHLVHRDTNIPYAVESFEPHAEYMRESGVWSRWDPRYLFQKFWEKRQMKSARFIMPVSEQYYRVLSKVIEAHKVLLMPCAVDLDRFAFNKGKRDFIRIKLGLKEDTLLGIYVGKFGGMYYDREAFRIFQRAKENLVNFHLIILSPESPQLIEARLTAAGYLSGEFHINYVPHSEVPAYLSAADFAFATYKPGYFKRFLSPVKIGEYWAAGLPVFLTKGVGDDHLIIQRMKVGVLFALEELDDPFVALGNILKEGREQLNQRIKPVASEYRNFEQSKRVYDTILESLS